jgi:DNA-binding response OmpR family regulator
MAKIVVIEDEEGIRNNLAMLLRIEGYEVLKAADGEEGLALVLAEKPDLVLCDVMMPKLDGHGVLTALHANSETAGIPFVFLTAMADKSDFRTGMTLGADDYLTKPFTRDEVLQTVAAQLRKSRVRRSETNALERTGAYLQHEIDRAQHLVANLVAPHRSQISGLRYLSQPKEIASGDLLLAHSRPNGDTVILLGDATGHGLIAALATLPVERVFKEGVAGNATLPELLGKVNSTLKRLLPTGMYLAAVLIEAQPSARRFVVWNGGMPSIQFFDPEGGHHGEAPSGNLPLGVLDSPEWGFVQFELSPGSRAYIYSDGLTESHDERGELFGVERLRESIAAHYHHENRLERIAEIIDSHRGTRAQHDDIALAELRLE